MDHDPAKIKDAVNYLISAPYATNHIKKLRNTVKRPRATPFKGAAECLNYLLFVGRHDLKAMEALLDYAEFNRDTANEKQSSFMAAKRERERKFIKIYELSHNKTLTVDQKTTLLVEQYDAWEKEKERFVEDRSYEFVANFDVVPEWKQKNAFKKDFWAMVDFSLDKLVEKAAAIHGKYAKKKPPL